VLLAANSPNYIKKLIFRFFNILVYRRSTLIHSSSQHVINELINQVGCLVGDNKKQLVQYWGMPLAKLSANNKKKLKYFLANEFGTELKSEEKFIVFPRGVKDIYNPQLVLSIINQWSEVNPKRVLVLFKAFSGDILWNDFKEKVNNTNCIFIDRLLNDQELAFFYSSSLAHVSVPLSDNLGGGVIEPMQMGSLPVLSDIKPYKTLSNMCKCFILKGSGETAINSMIESIESDYVYFKGIDECYSNPTAKIIDAYRDIVND